MSQEEFSEWLTAIHELHTYSGWFKDKHGLTFSFLWYDSVKESV